MSCWQKPGKLGHGLKDEDIKGTYKNCHRDFFLVTKLWEWSKSKGKLENLEKMKSSLNLG